MDKITKGKELIEPVLKSHNMNLEEFMAYIFYSTSDINYCYGKKWDWRQGWNDKLQEILDNQTFGAIVDRLSVALLNSYILVTIEDKTKRKVVLNDIYRGLTDFKYKYPNEYFKLAVGKKDIYAEDTFLQCILFGEVLYKEVHNGNIY